MEKSIIKNGAILGAFAIVSTALIALTFFGTKDQIAYQQNTKLRQLLNDVIPHSLHDNDLALDCIEVTHKWLGTTQPQRVYRARIKGVPSALAITSVAPNGYSGQISQIVGVDTEKKVLGVRVLEHKETPGLGDKIELSVSDWILSFTNKLYIHEDSENWKVKKDGGQFDQFTGATITPRAVVAAVSNTARYANEFQSDLFSAPSSCGTTTAQE